MSSAMPPAALGDAMDVPAMVMRVWRREEGTGAQAPPGALTHTPSWPSDEGPRLDLMKRWERERGGGRKREG